MTPPMTKDHAGLVERLRKYRGGDCEYRRLMDEAADLIDSIPALLSQARADALEEAKRLLRNRAAMHRENHMPVRAEECEIAAQSLSATRKGSDDGQ